MLVFLMATSVKNGRHNLYYATNFSSSHSSFIEINLTFLDHLPTSITLTLIFRNRRTSILFANEYLLGNIGFF